jgi:acetylglutamate kinase
MYEKNGVISGGMKPKVENALSAVESGVSRVVITLADNIGKANEGTVIQ